MVCSADIILWKLFKNYDDNNVNTLINKLFFIFMSRSVSCFYIEY